MKTLLLSLSLLLPVAASALEVEMTALIRTDSNRPITGRVVLEDLVSPDSFDGEHFKIVRGKSDEAIRFDADEHLRFRAATTYYHLTRARDYFVHTADSAYVRAMPKMTIRIEHTNKFSELGHFTHDNLDPQFNNALTVPAGRHMRTGKEWGIEIWFRPSKRIHLRELRVNDSQAREFQVLARQFRDQNRMQSFQRFLTTLISSWTDENSNVNPFSQESLVRTVGSSLILEAAYLSLDPLTKITSRKWYWLDTAMVPEIIYHEYAHAALSDHLVLSHSTAIIEGMADFFAGEIANSPKLANRIKRYNTYNGKNAKRKQQYMLQFEHEDYANTDFVFGLLWQLKKVVGEEKGLPFMYELRKRVNTNSNIRSQLVEGILQTCDAVCDLPFVDKLKILQALHLRGL
jgi:hypothetical protein